MVEIKDVKTQKTTVNTGDKIKITFKVRHDVDYPYGYPHGYPIAAKKE